MLAIFVWSAADSGRTDGKWIAAAGLATVAAVLLTLSLGLIVRDRDGAAFATTALAICSSAAAFFVGLYPNVLVSSTRQGNLFGTVTTVNNLTVFSTSSSHHTLALMAIVALIFTPIVLVYQTWTYWVFRARLRGDSLPGEKLLGGSGSRPTS